MLTHVYADAAVPVADADLLRVLVQAEKGLGRSGSGAGAGYDRLIGLSADGQIYRIVVSQDHAQTRAVYQVLTWFGCRRVDAELRPGIDDLFEMPSVPTAAGWGQRSVTAPRHLHRPTFRPPVR